MPDVSIVIKATDRFSDAIKTMRDSSTAFTKDMSGMQSKLDALNKTKATLKVDVDKAKQDLKAAEKQFAATGDAIDEMNLQEKQATFETARRNLSLVSKEAANVEKQMLKTGDAFSKADNQAGGSSGGQFTETLSTLAKAGGLKMVGDVASQWAKTFVTSAGGSEAGILFSSALSGAASGAAIGSIIPGIGTAIGAAIGGGLGLLQGGNQVYEQRDDTFKSYYQEAYETQISAQESSLSTGSALAAQRETDKISFSTLFKNSGIADTYLANLVEMANNTPFLYDDLTTMSKTLATYGYSAQADSTKAAAGEKDFNYILDVLQTIGDTGAALGQSTSDMSMVATALGRMKSSNKTSLEYLNILNDRGIGAVGMLADAYGVSQGTMYDMISKGKVEGTKAAEIILQALTDSFAGSMETQSKTFSGLTSTVEGLTQELDNAMGEGYNEGRMAGLQAQRDWLSGESGEAVMEANKAIGAWKAELENSKEQYIRDAVDAMMSSEEYQTAKDSGDAAEMGRLIMEAKVQGMNEYNASEGAQLALESEKSLIESIRNDTSLDSNYWDAGYEKGQEFTKGVAAGITSGWSITETLTPEKAAKEAARLQTLRDLGLYAVGIDYVPYDNFPALLHQGERVQTAVEARSERSSSSVQIVMNGTTIREDADVDRVASALLEKMELAGMRG